jgi:hypothetical protein
VRAALLEQAAHGVEHHDDRGLVVGAENRAGRVADDVVLPDDGLDRGLRRDRVGVSAQENG